MAEFTQPEPINHNELRRLLCELVDSIYDDLVISGEHLKDGIRQNAAYENALDKKKQRLYKKIDSFILDGDDS